jgi:phage-related protein
VADTSLVFNIIAKDSGLGRALDKVSSAFRSAGRDAEQALDRAGAGTENLDRQLAEAKSHLLELAREYERTGDKSLFGKMSRDKSLIANLEKVRSTLVSVSDSGRAADSVSTGLSGVLSRLGGTAGGASSMLAGMGGNVMAAMSSLTGLAMAAGAVTAGMFVAGGAIGVLGGAAAALPGMLSGAIAAIATLKLGLFGLGENWKAMNAPSGGGGGGGGGAVQDMTPKLRAVQAAQRGVARAARDITEAQEDLRDATADLNRAREEELERIEDVRRSLASARADEADAVQSLAEARMQLALAEARGNPDEIRRAEIAVQQQAAALEEAKDQTEDLQKESDEAARKGVEGSERVVDAKERESDAQQRVRDAVEQHQVAVQQLADAQKALKDKMDAAGSSAGGLAAQLPKISRSAQEFLNVLKELQPAFEDLRLHIQEKLFAGLAEKMRTLANVWIPQLKISLGGIADTINGVVKTAFDSLSKPSFVRNMSIAMEGFRGSLDRVGQAIAGPLVDAWGRLARASVPFMDMLSEKLAGIITRFSEWIARMDDSGKLDAFMRKAAEITGHVLDIFEDLGRIAGSVISILFGSNLGSTDAWENLADGMDKVADWFGNPKNQKMIQDFFNDFGGAAFQVFKILKDIDDIITTVEGWGVAIEGAYNDVKKFFEDLPKTIEETFAGIGRSISEFPGKVSGWLASLPGVIGNIAINAVNTLGYYLGYGIGMASRILAQLPGVAFNALRGLPNTIGNIVSQAVQWFQQMGPRAYNAMVNVGSWIRNALSSLPSMMFGIGYNVVVGLWRGISSLSSWLWRATVAFARSIYQGFRSGLGIDSPSKVMRDGIGRWIPAGIAAGIDAGAGAVWAATDRIAAGLANTSMSVGGLDMAAVDSAVAAATGTVQVAAARRRQETIPVVLDVRGADSEMKRMIRKMVRTDNLNQTA